MADNIMTDNNEGDPEEEIQCPYDKVHMVRRKRMQYHIQACRKQHPEAKLFSCSFNAKHRLPKVELPFHHMVCPDKYQHITNVAEVDADIPANNIVPEQIYTVVDCEEDWDSELTTNHFNLSAAGGINSYTKPRDTVDVAAVRQPRDISQILQKSLPPGGVLPGQALRQSAVGGVASSSASSRDTPGAWGGAKGFGRGSVKSSQSTEPPPVGSSLTGSRSSSSTVSSASSNSTSPRRPVVRAATSTAAFSLTGMGGGAGGMTSAGGLATGGPTSGGSRPATSTASVSLNGPSTGGSTSAGGGVMSSSGGPSSADGWTMVGSTSSNGGAAGGGARDVGNNVGGARSLNGIGRGRGYVPLGGCSGEGDNTVRLVQPGYNDNSTRSQPAFGSDEDEGSTAVEDPAKLKRKLQKKLKQIEKLEQDRAEGVQLDEAQLLKLRAKESIESQLKEL